MQDVAYSETCISCHYIELGFIATQQSTFVLAWNSECGLESLLSQIWLLQYDSL